MIREAPPRDELAIKLALTITTGGVDVRSVIQTQRTATVRALQEYTRLGVSKAARLTIAGVTRSRTPRQRSDPRCMPSVAVG